MRPPSGVETQAIISVSMMALRPWLNTYAKLSSVKLLSSPHVFVESAHRYQRVEEYDEGYHDGADSENRGLGGEADALGPRLRAGLAADRDVALAADPPALEEEDEERRDEQREGEQHAI